MSCTAAPTSPSFTFYVNRVLSVVDSHKDPPRTANGFINAVIFAWANHLILSLRVDDVWTMFAHLIRRIIDERPEKYRSRLVAHEGQKELKTYDIDPRTPEAYEAMVALIQKDGISDLPRLLSNDFSTSDTTSRLYSLLLTMATYKHYYVYSMDYVCGIRGVTLHGSHAEWMGLTDRIDAVVAILGEEPPSIGHFRTVLKNIQRTSAMRFPSNYLNPVERGLVVNMWRNVINLKTREINNGCAMVTRSYLRGWLVGFDGINPSTAHELGYVGSTAASVDVNIRWPGLPPNFTFKLDTAYNHKDGVLTLVHDIELVRTPVYRRAVLEDEEVVVEDESSAVLTLQ